MTVETLIKLLGLEPHPEGGAYRETWRDHSSEGARGAGSSIYYLLRENERSRRHRIDATELWHHYAGAPVELLVEPEEEGLRTIVLGTDIEAGQRPQVIVPAHAWQSARSLGAWTLVGCTVSPAFDFEQFEIDPNDLGPA